TICMAIDAAERLEQYEELLHLTLIIAPFLVNHGWLSLAQQYLQHACEVASQQHVTPKALCKLLVYTGKTFVGLGNFAEGLAAYYEGLHLARSSQDHACVAEILAMLTWQAHMWGEYEQADEYLHEGLEIATALDLPDTLWMLLRSQVSQAWARGEYAQAEAAYLRGLSLVERLSDQSLADVTMYYCFLGVFEGERGHYAQAETLFQQATIAAQKYGFQDFIPFLIARRAMMRLMCNPSDELREELLQAITTAQAVGSWGFAVYAHKALAQLELLRGNFDRAEEVAQQALAIIEPFQTQNRVGEHRTILAQVELARGRYAEAANYLQQALPLLRIYGASEDQAIALLAQGEIEIGRGNLDAAKAAFQELFQVGPADFLAPLALGHYGMARIVAARNQQHEARQLGEKSLQMLEGLKHVRAQEVRAWLETLS
ncbi:MAG: tetratricopeptide repeat protein, partial [Ktedonobacteraceae bacterium]